MKKFFMVMLTLVATVISCVSCGNDDSISDNIETATKKSQLQTIAEALEGQWINKDISDDKVYITWETIDVTPNENNILSGVMRVKRIKVKNGSKEVIDTSVEEYDYTLVDTSTIKIAGDIYLYTYTPKTKSLISEDKFTLDWGGDNVTYQKYDSDNINL